MRLIQLSSRLQRFPIIWKNVVKVYEIFQFVPNKKTYSGNFLPTSRNLKLKNYSIVFDAQCLQTLTRQRGIGRYSLNLISIICKSRPNQLFAAVLTSIASEDDLEKALCSLEELGCSNLDILILNPFIDNPKINFVQARENLRSQLELIGCSVVVVLSPFEKHDSVVAFPFSSTYKQVGVIYDLIPFLYPGDFLFSRKRKTSYIWSLNNLVNFHLLLAISKETANHWNRMNLSKAKMRVIYGGGFIGYPKQEIDFKDRSGILSVSAEQSHKNLARLIESYSLLPKHIQSQHSLIIVGIRSIGVKRKFVKLSRKASGQVVFMPYLDEDELLDKYQSSRLLVMPSLVEGLSLPILEAWSNGLVAIGSKGTVAEELIKTDSLLFDPLNSLELSNCIKLLLTSEDYWNNALKLSMVSARIFTWKETARIVLKAIESLGDD